MVTPMLSPTKRVGRALGLAVCFAGFALSTQPATATWSIIIIDSQSHEVAVGSATCLTGFDLEFWLPVVRVDVGGACAQSFVDSSGLNRVRIWNELQNGTHPEDLLVLLDENDTGHQTRQYGIVDAIARAATFTGTGAGVFASGVVGTTGTLTYAIQGNVLTGAAVVDMAEQAVLNTPGDIADKLMAAMEAARSMGGDGRCSCSNANPDSCGSPPPEFTKSAHVGFMVVARTGDSDGGCNVGIGCANGSYFLDLNVPNQGGADLDPVLQLQDMFDTWRADHIGRPDAVHSSVVVDPPIIPGFQPAGATLTLTIRDWQDTELDGAGLTVTATHMPDSAGITTIGAPSHLGGGVFEIPITGNDGGGIDRFRVQIDDGIRPVVVIPVPTLIVAAKSDLDVDGDVDRDDHAQMVGCMGGPAVPPVGKECVAADVDEDVDVDAADFARLQREYHEPNCTFIRILTHPSVGTATCGEPFTLSIEAAGEPALRYQWMFHGFPQGEGVPIPGATGPEYFIPAASDADRGYYSCLISNTCGTLASDVRLLRVTPNPCP